MRGVSSFPEFWLLRCSWERWTILLQYGCMGLGTFMLLFSLTGFKFVHFRVGPGILHLYTRTTLLHPFAFWTRVFTILSWTLSFHPSTTYKHVIHDFVFYFLSSSSIVFGRGESEWMTYEVDYDPRLNSTCTFHRHLHLLVFDNYTLFGWSTCSDSTSSDTRWVSIMTVYTDGDLLHFESYATLPSADIHVWITSWSEGYR